MSKQPRIACDQERLACQGEAKNRTFAIEIQNSDAPSTQRRQPAQPYDFKCVSLFARIAIAEKNPSNQRFFLSPGPFTATHPPQPCLTNLSGTRVLAPTARAAENGAFITYDPRRLLEEHSRERGGTYQCLARTRARGSQSKKRTSG